MSELKITFESGAERFLDSASQVRTPTGYVTASTLQAGDWTCIHSDGSDPVKIQAVDPVV